MKDKHVYPGYQNGPGMEVRDLFAAHALQGILAHEGASGDAFLHAQAALTAAEIMMELRDMSIEQREEALSRLSVEADEGAILELADLFEQMLAGAKAAGGEHSHAE